MAELAITIVAFLVTVGVLVVVHEFGHYSAARLMDVKILRFNIGFGKPLWLFRRGRDATEWVIASIPLGGYVKMLDEREAPVTERDRPRAFNNKSVAARIFIVLAGPLANFLLAILLYWVLFVSGIPGDKPVVASPPPNTPAAAAGFGNGDTILAIAEEPVQTWNDVRYQLLGQAVRHDATAVDIETRQGIHATRRLDLSGITRDDLDKDLFGKIGLRPFRPPVPAKIGRVLEQSAAERAGLARGDVIVAMDGRPIATWFDFTSAVIASPGRPITMDLERSGQRLRLTATPEARRNGTGQLGVEGPAELKTEFDKLSVTVRYGPIDAVGQATRKVWDLSLFSVKMLGRMVMGDVSWKNLSGPITIADYAGQSAQAGWIASLGFLALVSVSLGVLNLLPIPLLDGGHLVYYLAEILKGTPVSERTMEIGQRLGLALLLGLTFFAFYNDINRLFTG
ncbi:MAG TPA: RIP metalloprotease RseP [Usitatibacter sp.]|nr:RIP metalloprotease RseP [Usitatibacter sp.]